MVEEQSFRFSGRRLLLPALVAVAMFPVRGLAQQDNLHAIMQAAAGASDSLLAAYSASDSLSLRVVDHPASWTLSEKLYAEAEHRGIVTRPVGSAGEELVVAITMLAVRYVPLDDDMIERQVLLELTALRHRVSPLAAGSSDLSRELRIEERDTVRADQLSVLEGSGYEFARGLAETRASNGFWKRIVEPAVVLGASAVMVILLFTVRSK